MTPIQRAFALIWLSPRSDELMIAARGILRNALSPEERQAAVQWGMLVTRRTEQGLEMLPLDETAE
jgi:hypothetical protein